MQLRTSWPAVSAALFAGVVAAGYVGKLPPALPALKTEFGLSLVEAGWVVSTFNTVALTAAVGFGVMADWIGAFRFALAGLALLADDTGREPAFLGDLGDVRAVHADGAEALGLSENREHEA